MKKLFLLFALLVSAVQLSFADSALTDTEFYKAYLDVPIVKAAADQPNVLSEEAKAYLFDEANPLDVKLALINAVGWEFKGSPPTRTTSTIASSTSPKASTASPPASASRSKTFSNTPRPNRRPCSSTSVR